jgi:hypothetical protein
LQGKGSCHYRLIGEYGVTWLFGLSGTRRWTRMFLSTCLGLGRPRP